MKIDEEEVTPQMYLFGCVLESGKEVTFNPEDDGFEHHLDLRMACTDPTTKDELHLVEVEGKGPECEKVTAALVSLKPSILPSMSVGGFNVLPPAVFRLKCGSGPIHISGQHIVMMDLGRSFEDDDDGEEEEEEEEEDVKVSKKRPASSPALKSQKKIKMEVDADEDDDEDDEDEDGDEETPVKAKPTPKSTQNGKRSKASTPPTKQVTTPKRKVERSPKSPSTPKLTLPEVQAKMAEAVKKGVTLPKAQPKFENFVKNSFRVSDTKAIADLWKWRQTITDPK